LSTSASIGSTKATSTLPRADEHQRLIEPKKTGRPCFDSLGLLEKDFTQFQGNPIVRCVLKQLIMLQGILMTLSIIIIVIISSIFYFHKSSRFQTNQQYLGKTNKNTVSQLS
jgi:hypothetical protein